MGITEKNDQVCNLCFSTNDYFNKSFYSKVGKSLIKRQQTAKNAIYKQKHFWPIKIIANY